MEFTKSQQAYAKVVQKAWEDAEFKANLIADPIATIEKFTGTAIKVPTGKKLVVLDQMDESTVFVNIPGAHQEVEDMELTDDQLEKAAGGLSTIDFGDILTGGTGPFNPTFNDPPPILPPTPGAPKY